MQFEKWYDVDVLKPRQLIPDLGFPVFKGDANSVRVGVHMFSNREPLDVTGSVEGYVLLPNGAMAPVITGEKEGNAAWIDLSELSLAIIGRIQVAIRLVDGTEETVIFCASATVRRVGSETIIDPDNVIPTWDDILDKIAAMDQAAEDCEDAAAAATEAAEHAVQYDAEQTLTDAQKETARGNIEAASEDDVTELNSAIGRAAQSTDSDADGVDLDITDNNGNVILRLEDGHVKTKNFDSSAIDIDGAKAKPTNADDGVFDITDGGGNVVLRLENGYIKTKKTDNTNPFEVPSYYFPYLDEKCSRIKELLEASGGDAFIFCTDQHFDQGNAGNAFRLINYVADKCRINKLFMGGDLTDGWDAEHSDQFRRAIGGKYYYINGNHDYMKTGATPEILAYTNEATVDSLMMGDALRNYYYVDNPKKQIRYIVLNGFDATGTTWQQGYEADQLTWLNDVAMDIPDGWHIIVLSHIFYSVTAMDNPALVRVNWAEPVLTAIDSHDNAGSVLCILCGHTHVDGVKATDGGIPIIITTCDKNKPYNPGAGYEWWITDRDDDTVKEQAFDVCVVDLTHNKITAVRIGGYTTGDAEDDADLFDIGERVINI